MGTVPPPWVIDLGAADAPAAFARALAHDGACVVIGGPARPPLLAEVAARWIAFFDSDERADWAFDEALPAGYFPIPIRPGRDIDFKEYFYYHPDRPCPDGPAIATRALHEALGAQALTLLRWACQAAPGAPQPAVETRRAALRVMRYPAWEGGLLSAAFQRRERLGETRAGAHRDVNLLTLLPPATEAGFQIERPDGTWWDAPARGDALVVLAGRQLGG